MLAIVLAILPVFLLIFAGFLMARQGFPGAGFWAPTERVTYYLLFPALIVATMAGADLDGGQVAPMALVLVAALLLVTLGVIALRRHLGVDGPGLTSLIQGGTRMNTFICLAIAEALWGAPGLALSAAAVAVIVPTANVICVLALARFGAGTRPDLVGILRSLARNPLIVATVLGLGLNVTGLGQPPVLGDLLEMLGRAALPLGLLAVGAALDFAALRRRAPVIAQSTAFKLLAVPALTAGLLALAGVQGLAATVALLFMGSPTAVSSYILARQLGGDAPLMAGIVTAQTTLSLITLPVVLGLAGAAYGG